MRIEDEALLMCQDRMEKALAVLKSDYGNVRAGRANPQILNKIMVDYYGTMTPLTQMANISVPDARTLTIALWDAGTLKAAEKAILTSDLGLNPSNDGKNIRLTLPELTAERRQDLVKQVRKRSEEGKIALRAIRRDCIEDIRKEKKAGDITEDDQKILEEDAQKFFEKYSKLVDEASAEKEAEITEI